MIKLFYSEILNKYFKNELSCIKAEKQYLKEKQRQKYDYEEELKMLILEKEAVNLAYNKAEEKEKQYEAHVRDFSVRFEEYIKRSKIDL